LLHKEKLEKKLKNNKNRKRNNVRSESLVGSPQLSDKESDDGTENPK
jgi:hypothetical protein